MFGFGRSLAGAGYVILNIIRGMNIISLLAIIIAHVVMLVKTFVVNKFFFFDACGHVITVVIGGFLIITELPLFKKFFARNWPLFSHKSGFVMLGVMMLVLGNNTLGNLNKEATSQENLGLAFWRIVISSGIVIIIMGVINIVASYVFRNTKPPLTARQVRSHGATAEQKIDVEDKKPSLKSYLLNRKSESLPSYHSRSPVTKSENSGSPRARFDISSPINSDKDQFSKYSTSPDISAPSLAHHPAMYSNRI